MATPGQLGSYDYDSAIRNRLANISATGDAQTTWQKLQQQRAAAQQAIEDRRNQIIAAATPTQPVGQQTTTGDDGFDSFKNAIKQKESGGNYGARNPSGALGAYQILGSNLGGKGSGWDYQALGYDVTPQQFITSPQVQDAVASYYLKKFYDRYGPAGAAVAWYAGEGAAQKYANTGQASNARQGAYPSISAYSQDILKRMGR